MCVARSTWIAHLHPDAHTTAERQSCLDRTCNECIGASDVLSCAANVILFSYYLAPLSTIALVLRKRDSSSLTLPMCIMNTVNGTLWLIYGLVISDPFIWVPHGSGAVLGALQTALRLIFPQRESERCERLRAVRAV